MYLGGRRHVIKPSNQGLSHLVLMSIGQVSNSLMRNEIGVKVLDFCKKCLVAFASNVSQFFSMLF